MEKGILMSGSENGSVKYQVKIEQIGRAGWAYYIEQEKQLPFSWENFGTPGDGIIIPSPTEWNKYCEKRGADWAKERREEILQRVAQSFLKRRYGNGSFEITDRWVYIRPGPTLLSRLLEY